MSEVHEVVEHELVVAPGVDRHAVARPSGVGHLLHVGDAGGVGLASIRVANGRIVPESIIVGPDAPESSWEITRLEGFSELLMIRLARPGAGAVRTGLLGMFNVMSDSQRTSILASAYDNSGNVAKLYEVAVRSSSDDAAGCR